MSLRAWWKLQRIKKEATASYWRLLQSYLVRQAAWITREEAAEGLGSWLRSLCEHSPLPNGAFARMPFHADRYLGQICNGARVFSYGIGGSAAALASRARELIVIEDDVQLAEIANHLIAGQSKAQSGEVRHINAAVSTPDRLALPPEDPQSYMSPDQNDPQLCYYAYATAIDVYPDNSFDVIVLSGRTRHSCFMHAVSKVRNHGYIVIDDAEAGVNRRVFEMAEELGFSIRKYYGVRPGAFAVSETLFLRKVRTRFSLNDLDKKLEQYLDFDHGFFIEAGGNNGVRQSNSYYFESQRGWRGLLVEAVPALAHECRQYRPRAIVEQVALSSPDQVPGKVTIHYAGLMSVVENGMGSEAENAAHVRLGCEIQKIQTYDVDVDTATISGLLDKHGVRKVDLLSLDVEGFELQALSGVDFNRHAPAYILVEVRYPGIRDFLERHHYSQVAQLTHHDYLYRLSR